MKHNYIHINKISRLILTTIILSALTLSSKAQLNPFQGIFYQNKYLYNPAMAGIDTGLNINLAYRQQWNGFPGTPKTGAVTVDYQSVKRTGLGLNITDDQAGLIRQTRFMGTYAYHIPLSDNNQKLNFGISLGIDDSRLNYNNVIGDLSDQEIAQYNQLKAYVDGDFGAAYTSNNLYIGTAVPNLKALFFQTSDIRFDADRMLFITVASYKIPLQKDNNSFVLEPLAAYRMVKGYKDIIDLGLNLMMNNYGLRLQSIYHTSENMAFGLGLDQPSFDVNFFYNIETGALNRYARGTFEFGLKIKLFK
jgi:type IX secretion system PorP/SprF family membrane protein